jgi:hypothetical protein
MSKVLEVPPETVKLKSISGTDPGADPWQVVLVTLRFTVGMVTKTVPVAGEDCLPFESVTVSVMVTVPPPARAWMFWLQVELLPHFGAPLNAQR